MEGGYEVYDIAEGKVDLAAMSASGTSMANNVHSFIGGEVKATNSLAVGATYDYSYKYYNGYYGPRQIDGTSLHNWKISVPFKSFGPNGKLSSAGGVERADGKTFYGLDVGAAVKIVFGLEVKLKLGIAR